MGYVFIAHGDITQISASAVAFSTSSELEGDGWLYSGFQRNLPGFSDNYAALRETARGAPVGNSYWLPLTGCGPLRGVVAVVSVGSGSDPGTTEKSQWELTVRVAIETAVRELGRRGTQEQLLIALPSFHVGVGSGRCQLIELARTQIRTAREVLARADMAAADVVFVTYTRSLYHVYLHARQLEDQAGAEPRTDSGELTPPPALAAAISRSECVFFVGSGLSSGAGLPSWSSLIQHLSADLGLTTDAADEHDYYLDLAQWHRENITEPGRTIENVIADLFSTGANGYRPTLAHYLMFALPFDHVITTNYDDLIERALSALRLRHFRVVDQEDVPATGQRGGRSVIKLHGDAPTRRGIVIARDDYDTFFSRRPAMASLLEGLMLNHTFFFIGYGLRDPNFRQIYSRIADILADAKRPAYATTFDPASPYLIQQWQKKGLELLPIFGRNAAEKSRNLLIWLDRLAELAIGDPQTFLAPTPDSTPGRLGRLREQLMAVGAEVEDLCYHRLPPADAVLLAPIIELVIQLGWRPSSNRPLSYALEMLAESLAERPAIQSRILALALEHTVQLEDVDAILKKLDQSRE